ncbi:MAG: hypothetical protein ACI9NC_003898 [Verrucomicrobiales bacterium]
MFGIIHSGYYFQAGGRHRVCRAADDLRRPLLEAEVLFAERD